MSSTQASPGELLVRVADEAASCTNCNLFRHATQTVFGEGPVPAAAMLLGEQPGDHEDLAGRPFVGPAGRVLDEVLDAVGLTREQVYLTNAVKHFKWTRRGQRRVHQRPNVEQITACSPWLEQEVAHVQPQVVVAMGATAVRSLFPGRITISRLRGRVHRPGIGVPTVVTVHPAAIGRLRDREDRQRGRDALAADLRLALTLTDLPAG